MMGCAVGCPVWRSMSGPPIIFRSPLQREGGCKHAATPRAYFVNQMNSDNVAIEPMVL